MYTARQGMIAASMSLCFLVSTYASASRKFTLERAYELHLQRVGSNYVRAEQISGSRVPTSELWRRAEVLRESVRRAEDAELAGAAARIRAMQTKEYVKLDKKVEALARVKGKKAKTLYNAARLKKTEYVSRAYWDAHNYVMRDLVPTLKTIAHEQRTNR